MVRKVACLDLNNYRTRAEGSRSRVYDSLEWSELPSTLHSKIAKFDSVKRTAGEVQEAAAANADYVVRTDHRGRYFASSDIIAASRKQVFSRAESLRGDVKQKDRVNVTTMNRVMDNVHVVVPPKDFLPYENLAWSQDKVRRFPPPPDTTFGPGHYDLTAFETSRWGPCPRSVKFSDVPREMSDAFEESVDLSHVADCSLEKRPFSRCIKAAFRAERNRRRARSATAGAHSAVRDEQLRGGSASSPAASGVAFSASDRWLDPLRRPEAYVKTTGMTLSPDFDRHLDKRTNGPFASTKRFPPPAATLTLNLAPLFLDALPFHAPTLEYSSLRSPINYSSFRSTAAVGLQLAPNTTGSIGPMQYPGAFASSVAVHEPHRLSRAFQGAPGGLDAACAAAPDPPSRMVPFAETNPLGPVFARGCRAAGLREVARNKVGKIYPRLAERLGIVEP